MESRPADALYIMIGLWKNPLKGVYPNCPIFRPPNAPRSSFSASVTRYGAVRSPARLCAGNCRRETQVATACMFGMIAVCDSKKLHSLVEVGRLWQRMQLLGTLRGVAMQPLSQPIERRDRERQLGLPPTYANALAELQQDNSWQAVMPFRLGYPECDALPSPRRSLSSVLLLTSQIRVYSDSTNPDAGIARHW